MSSHCFCLSFSLKEAAVTSGLLSFSALDSDFFSFFSFGIGGGRAGRSGQGKTTIQSSGGGGMVSEVFC